MRDGSHSEGCVDWADLRIGVRRNWGNWRKQSRGSKLTMPYTSRPTQSNNTAYSYRPLDQAVRNPLPVNTVLASFRVVHRHLSSSDTKSSCDAVPRAKLQPRGSTHFLPNLFSHLAGSNLSDRNPHFHRWPARRRCDNRLHTTHALRTMSIGLQKRGPMSSGCWGVQGRYCAG
jgi:hypothetical protein